jgi:hypothetical protein
MRGQTVVVKEFNGLPLVVRIWEVRDSGVFIHSEEEFNRRMRGEKPLDPVGFPYEDVFEYDEAAKEQLKKDRVDWRRFSPLRPPVTATSRVA